MIEPEDLLRLQAWFSPAFPVGAYAYSSGLENAVGSGLVLGSDDLQQDRKSVV